MPQDHGFQFLHGRSREKLARFEIVGDLLKDPRISLRTPGHHDPVGGPQDFIDVLHSLTVFDLRNDPDRTLSGIEQFAHGRDIGRIPDERVRNVVELKLDRVRDKATVFLGQPFSRVWPE